MSDNDGTYAALMRLQSERRQPREAKPTESLPERPAMPAQVSDEDINAVPHISQNYRFTETDLRFLREKSFKLSDQFGIKVSQNAILRIALAYLRLVCQRNPRSNPLLDAISRLKR